MSTSLQRIPDTVRIDADGNEIGPIDGQIGWVVRKQGIGRPAVARRNGEPVVIPPNASIPELQRVLDGWWGCARLYPLGDDGEVIEDAPVAVVYLEPDLSSFKPEQMHWMRLDRVFDTCGQMINMLESKDMMLTRITEALIDNQRELLSGVPELLRAATSMTNVATGIERPEIDLDAMSERVAEAVEEKAKERDRAPWFVMLADSKLGQGVVEMVSGFAKTLADMQHKNK